MATKVIIFDELQLLNNVFIPGKEVLDSQVVECYRLYFDLYLCKTQVTKTNSIVTNAQMCIKS